ncbi:MAG: ParA family protein [Deltaproteobacteria bacterium]|nr:ParA family protein [Deltaproteobacteria bacterium]
MSIPVVAFFNNKGGVGKTSLVYHLSWIYSDMGRRVLAADLDPQANLTAAFLDDDRLEELWGDGVQRMTVFDAIDPLLRGIGDISDAHCEPIDDKLTLLVGDLELARFEDELSLQWPQAADGKERAFRVLSAFWRLTQRAAERMMAEVVLLDLGPNLGAINRVALIASDYVVIPLGPDLFSLQGLKNLGPTLRMWREQWHDRVARNKEAHLDLPAGSIVPLGYVVLQHATHLNRPVRAYDRWMRRIPEVYATEVLEKPAPPEDLEVKDDPLCLGQLKHYRSLMPMAQEARKPIFHLTTADGALGAHVKAVMSARRDFENLARAIATRSWDQSTRKRKRRRSKPAD